MHAPLFKYLRLLLVLALAATLAGMASATHAQAPLLGVVVMHGKGGSPTRHVADLAGALAGKDYLVANLEMPWSGGRDYDVDVSRAEEEVESALAALRAKGARKVFVAGHSQGGLFALHFAGKHAVDGIIAIVPGGNTAAKVVRDNLGDSLAQARRLVDAGKGAERTRLKDYEGAKGVYPIVTTPAAYVSWFDPEGAMNMDRAAHAANPGIPILWIVAKHDYPNLRRNNIPQFKTLPRNPLTKLYEPDSNHLGAPTASIDEIVRWTREVADTVKR